MFCAYLLFMLFSSTDLAAVFQAQELLVSRGLAVLAAWALINLVVSGYFLFRADRHHEGYYFHSMNIGWGAVNAALAGWGLLHLQFSAPAGLELAEIFRRQLFNENLFLFNAGLDVAYVMTGFYLRAKAAGLGQLHPARLHGFGRSLWIQGGFLLVFDAAMWGLLHRFGQDWLLLT